jgi:hypothetical protein
MGTEGTEQKLQIDVVDMIDLNPTAIQTIGID